MDIKMGCKIHNRFDIEVKDVKTGEVVKKGYAENIVLDSMYSSLTSDSYYFNAIGYGGGIGVLEPTRTSLFSQIAQKNAVLIENVYNLPPLASYSKKKIAILPEEAIGETITEVGILGYRSSNYTLVTHALIKDSEGNALSIGPKTETQEITIYATVFAEIILPEGMSITTDTKNRNSLILKLLGAPNGIVDNHSGTGALVYLSTDKTPTIQNKLYNTGFANKLAPFKKVGDRTVSTGRIRFGTADGTGKTWSIGVYMALYDTNCGLWRILFPNPMWPGYQFVGKSIGVGDGVKTKFVLPWSDINTDKEYKIYVDGALKTEGTDYTLANSETETSITFITAPTIDAQITGDWWVDYIPKDSEHVLDITFTIEFGEGV